MRLLHQILLFFLLAQVLGIYTGRVLFHDAARNPYVQPFSFGGNPNAPENALYFFLMILLGAAFFLLLMRYLTRLSWSFKLLELVVVTGSSSLVFYALARPFAGYGPSMAFGILAGLLFSGLRWFVPHLKNPAAILATAGTGALCGISLGVVPAVLFLLLLTLYDYIAVFITRHMVAMAAFLIQKDLAFTVTARQEMPDDQGRKRIDLGTGDLIAPILLEVSVLPMGLAASLSVFLGAALALGVFLWLALKKKLVLPAIPPIALGSLLFFLLGKLLGFY